MEQLPRALGYRGQRELGLAILRPPEVRHEQQLRAALAQLDQRWQRPPDARVVAHLAVRDRDVEVDPHEHALALDGSEAV